ncbi:MAG: hypothetical protein CSH49_07555 [Alcanivorax sp.]|nr:MAG: hypothetical protein CSH49_07555 [Alcanivorax sp.]
MATWSITRLRWVLGLSLLLLIIPTLVLAWKASQQLKWEALYQQRQLAEELTKSIDLNLQRWIAVEQSRPVTHYRYLLLQSSQGQTNYLQRSPLSKLPDGESPPGLVGYFQVDDAGDLQTPLLPQSEANAMASGLAADDIEQRRRIKRNIRSILSANQLVTPASVAEEEAQADSDGSAALAQTQTQAQAQAPFEKLAQNQIAGNRVQSLGKIAELDLERSFADAEPALQKQSPPKEKARQAPQSREASLAPAAKPAPSIGEDFTALDAATQGNPQSAITIFSNTASAFSLALLESGHLLLFRDAWYDDQRWVQGLLLDQQAFIDNSIQQVFQQSNLSHFTNLVVAFNGNVLRILPAMGYQRYALGYSSLSVQDVSGTLILQTALSSPLTELELIFSARHLPDGPGGAIITWASLILMLLLISIFTLLYRFGVRQIRMLQQQQNFIASVSHELKTPLTSIRMFSEMLKEGWATPAKQQEYYHFIADESDRLSRLITNVLQLARMERQELKLDIKPCPVNQLIELLRSRLESQVAATEFTLCFSHEDFDNNEQIQVDTDAMMQILMNLVDNSLKFAKRASNKQLDLHIRNNNAQLEIVLRDYGPGIPDQERKRIFDLFYRIGNELTRSAQGTGIGLALVQQLVSVMGGSIEIQQPDQGAAFCIRFPML